MPETNADYKKLLTEVIKRQIVILGPDITLAKARNVAELQVADDGTVLLVNGNPQEVTQKLVDQFMELSGMIVKKTMEPLLAGFPGLAAMPNFGAQTPASSPVTQQAAPISPAQTQQPITNQPVTQNETPVLQTKKVEETS